MDMELWRGRAQCVASLVNRVTEMSLGIRRYDHPLRFFVPSQTTAGKEYLVDLASYKQNGRCTCPHFTFRCEPHLSRGALPGPLLRCNHIEQARDFFIAEMLKKIAPHVAKDPEESNVWQRVVPE